MHRELKLTWVSYQVTARRFRPQKFSEVVGQEAIVKILLGALTLKRVAQCYLFCGSKGTGKTTMARLFAKALNCKNPDRSGESCTECSNCIEIARGSHPDVIEIDGASHRGIEDIRQINEAVYFAPAKGNVKIYLIDEVHMLTKEAFNALLKTLEEPPSHVKFFFATTEPQKIPPTILSRCQRLNLARISEELIVQKLEQIAKQLNVHTEQEALAMIARFSEGSLRDAQSLFDQGLSFGEGALQTKKMAELLGLPAEELFKKLDGAKGRYELAFTIAQELYASGKNISFFLEELIYHFRSLLLAKRAVLSNPAHTFYTEEQLLDILELLTEGIQTMKQAPSQRVHLEMLLLQVIRSHERPSFASLVKRLEELETKRPSAPVESAPIQKKAAAAPAEEKKPQVTQSRIDTLTRFAAKELGGTLRQ